MKRLLVLFLSLLVLCALPAQAQQKDDQKKKVSLWKYIDGKQKAYLFCYFTGNGDGLHYLYSYDGLRWEKIQGGKIFLKPEVGQSKLMRDPSILQGPDGTFHLVWTSGWTENNIGYASSKDLIHWSEQQEIPVMAHEPSVQNTWAPELFYHKKSHRFYIVWASTIPGRFPTSSPDDDYNHRLYYTTTKDFKHFEPSQLFYDPGFNVIDAAIIQEGCRYYMILKNETKEPVAEKNLRMVSSKKITQFPQEVSLPFSGIEWAEGPTPIHIGKYTYIYWDKYRNQKYGAVRTKSLRNPQWEDISGKIAIPSGVRHGTVFEVDESILKNLLKESSETAF